MKGSTVVDGCFTKRQCTHGSLGRINIRRYQIVTLELMGQHVATVRSADVL
jgi:hypothetical protein